MENGFPTQKILPFSEIVVDPADIDTSDDGSVATTIEFKAPVFLEGGQEYAIALASNSTKYSVYISRIGENDFSVIHSSPTNHILDLCSSLKTHRLGKQVNGKISNLSCTEGLP